MSRALLHLGFHKTGTTSMQGFLRRNQAVLYRHAAVLLPEQTSELSRWVWRLHMLNDDDVKQVIAEEIAGLLAGLDLDGRDLIVSDENLLGPMPRASDVDPYPHAAALLDLWCLALRTLPHPMRPTLLLTTRGTPDWATSIHAHLARKLSAVRLTEHRDSFVPRLAAHGFDPTITGLRLALPDLDIRLHDMADLAAAPCGLAQPFVDFLPLSVAERAELQPTIHENRAPVPEITDRLIALNRSDLDDEALWDAKRAMLRDASLCHMADLPAGNA